jgi:hypothetical protein
MAAADACSRVQHEAQRCEHHRAVLCGDTKHTTALQKNKIKVSLVATDIEPLHRARLVRQCMEECALTMSATGMVSFRKCGSLVAMAVMVKEK